MTLISSKPKNQTGLLKDIPDEKERQTEALSAAICRFLDWRERQARYKEAQRIRNMLTRRVYRKVSRSE